MKSLALISLTLSLVFLCGCTKRIEGFYGHGGQGFLFSNNGDVSVKLKGMPNAGARGTYNVSGDRLSVTLSNGTTHEFRIDGSNLVTIDARADRYQLMSLDAFMSTPAPEARPSAPPKSF